MATAKATKPRPLWSRLKAYPTWAIYTLFFGIALLIALGVIVRFRVQEARMIAAIRAEPTPERFSALDTYYWENASSWTNVIHHHAEQVLTDLAREFPDHATPLIDAQFHADLVDLYSGNRREPTLGLQALERPIGEAFDFALLAGRLLRYGAVDDAQRSADRALDLQTENAYVQYQAGQVAKHAGDFSTAEAYFRRCTANTQSPNTTWISDDCAAELLPASRSLTITLGTDRLSLIGVTQLGSPQEALTTTLRSSPQYSPAVAAWGGSAIGDASTPLARSFSFFDSEAHDDYTIAVSTTLIYNDLFTTADLSEGNFGIGLRDLPLTAYTSPTTLTVVTKDIDYFASHPFTRTNGKTVIWRVDQVFEPGKPLVLSLQTSELNALLLPITTSPRWFAVAYMLLYAFPTIAGLIIFARERQPSAHQVAAQPTTLLERIVHPRSAHMWLFDLALFVCGAFTILLPWYAFATHALPGPFSTWAWEASLVVLAVLLARLSLAGLDRTNRQQNLIVALSGVIFIGYLVPRISFIANVFGPIFMMVGAIGYFLLITGQRARIARLDWARLRAIYSSDRAVTLHAIRGLSRSKEVTEARRELEVSLAKGVLKAPEYTESLALIEAMDDRQQREESALKTQLGLQSGESPQQLLYMLGPGATPLANAFYALAFGALPFSLFLALAANQGEVALGGNVLSWLFTTAGVAWGPIFLFFFGYTYRMIIGDFGVIKGLAFSATLIACYVASALIWQFNPPDPVALWGGVIRILITFVFTGAMLDWVVSDYSWPEIRRSYSSPAFTTIVAVVGTAMTTVVTGVLTGTLSQMVGLVLQTGANALGAPTGPLP